MFTASEISNVVREPAVAGTFYPEDKQSLLRELDRMFAAVDDTPAGGTIVGLIVPHAGYIYSGSTAACAYAGIREYNFDSVVVVSPSHREYFNGISVFNGSAYSTPLGDVLIDKKLRDDLISGEKIILPSERGHQMEHALEVQLPFLQFFFPGLKIVPIVMGDQRREYCYHLGKKLAQILADTRALIIASTDLSHYHPYDEANELDQIVVGDIADFNHDKLMHDLESERTEACGGGPAVAVLAATELLGANGVRILQHCNSGDITGEHDRVVGYLSASIVRKN